MCGLFASVGFDPFAPALAAVAHRGPDGEGWAMLASGCGPVVLAHRRLSIFDVTAAGHQPMSDVAGRHHIVFNGAIYNFHALARDLEALGVRFRSQSDTEVLLQALIHWGEGALPRLRGMFAFVYWDDASKTLLAARDRFGIKPLYLRRAHGKIAFGSEIKQLLALEGWGRPGINAPRVHDFLLGGVTDHTGETLFDGIAQLRGGEMLRLDASGATPVEQHRRWYSLPEDVLALDETSAVHRTRDLLDDAVRSHLVADVEIGSCLSGGLDSSAIVAIAGRLRRQDGAEARMKTVNASYSIARVDESGFARLVAETAGVEGHFVHPSTEDVMALASDITWHQDEPFGSTSIIAQYRVFQMARSLGLKVMLDGQGADELLAGYFGAYPTHMAMQFRSGHWGGLAALMFDRRRHQGAGLAGQAMRLASALLPDGTAEQARSLHRRHTMHDWLAGDAPGTAAAYAAHPPAPRDINGYCRQMTQASNLPMLLHWEDRNAMAHGIESRVPFLDHPLAEFLLGLGNAHKIAGVETKRVLRQAVRGLVPDPVLDRRDKLGFATPEAEWMRGPLAPAMTAGVEATLRAFPAFFNAEGTRALAREMLEGRRPVDNWLWRVVNLGQWGERFSMTCPE